MWMATSHIPTPPPYDYRSGLLDRKQVLSKTMNADRNYKP